ncbi:uncharacterized protein [Dermacentor albipictus]|uniref:uncharacterized protein isoform X3 n=1 Tax=Dermacentor albipictus TaxID=60249 RepID=UPI0038FCFB25
MSVESSSQDETTREFFHFNFGYVFTSAASKVMSAIYNCSEKYEYYLPEEFFKRVKSDWFVEEAWRCIDDSTPTREAARGCDSEVAMTIMAHCIRAHMFEIAVCMAEFLQRPLAYLQRAFQSTM